MTLKLLYFAWVRERIGKEEEEIDLPPHVGTVAELLTWLEERGENYAHALEHSAVIRVAINQRHVPHEAKLPAEGEVALFPPMTGG